MKTYQVAVTYRDIQPEDGQIYEKIYEIEARTEFEAECLAMRKCENEAWYHDVDHAEVFGGCYKCHDTSSVSGDEDNELCPECAAFWGDQQHDMMRDGAI